MLLALGMALMILMNLKASLSADVYNIIEPLGWILTFSFAFLWLKNRIMIIGVLIITIYGNLKFWSVPLFDTYGPKFSLDLMKILAPSVYLFGLGCLIMAQWPQFYPRPLVSSVNLSLWKLLVILVGVSISMQLLGRM